MGHARRHSHPALSPRAARPGPEGGVQQPQGNAALLDAIQGIGQGGGSALPPHLAEHIALCGLDPAGIQIHTGAASAEAADALGTEAFTMGQDIHFGTGAWSPDTEHGEHVLFHEVAHAAFGHTASPPSGPPTVAGDRDEASADRAADALVAGEEVDAGALGGSGGGGTVACYGGGDEDYGGTGGVELDVDRGGGTTGGYEDADAAYAQHVAEMEGFKVVFEAFASEMTFMMLEDAAGLIRTELERYGFGPQGELGGMDPIELAGLAEAAAEMRDALAPMIANHDALNAFPDVGEVYPERHVDGAADDYDPGAPDPLWTDVDARGRTREALETGIADQAMVFESVASSACARYPVLAMFKQGRHHDLAHLSNIADEDSDAGLIAVLDGCNERLDAIDEVRGHLQDEVDDGDVDLIYDLPRVIRMTCDQIAASDEEQDWIGVWRREAKADEAMVEIALAAAQIGSIIAASLINPALGAAVAVGTSSMFASRSWKAASLEEAKSLTHLDRAQAIAIGHPEWLWVALEIAFVFTDVYAGARLLEEIAPLLAKASTRTREGWDALRRLADDPRVPEPVVDKLGEMHWTDEWLSKGGADLPDYPENLKRVRAEDARDFDVPDTIVDPEAPGRWRPGQEVFPSRIDDTLTASNGKLQSREGLVREPFLDKLPGETELQHQERMLDAIEDQFDDALYAEYDNAIREGRGDPGEEWVGFQFDRSDRKGTRFDIDNRMIVFNRKESLNKFSVAEEVQHALDFTLGAKSPREMVDRGMKALAEQSGRSLDEVKAGLSNADIEWINEWWHRRVFTRLIKNIAADKHGLGYLQPRLDEVHELYQEIGGKLSLEEILATSFDGVF